MFCQITAGVCSVWKLWFEASAQGNVERVKCGKSNSASAAACLIAKLVWWTRICRVLGLFLEEESPQRSQDAEREVVTRNCKDHGVECLWVPKAQRSRRLALAWTGPFGLRKKKFICRQWLAFAL